MHRQHTQTNTNICTCKQTNVQLFHHLHMNTYYHTCVHSLTFYAGRRERPRGADRWLPDAEGQRQPCFLTTLSPARASGFPEVCISPNLSGPVVYIRSVDKLRSHCSLFICVASLFSLDLPSSAKPATLVCTWLVLTLRFCLMLETWTASEPESTF